jgi:hypothetical protein
MLGGSMENPMLGGSIGNLMLGGSIGILMLVGSSGNQVRRNTIANTTLGGLGKPILGISIDNPTFRGLKQVPIILWSKFLWSLSLSEPQN